MRRHSASPLCLLVLMMATVAAWAEGSPERWVEVRSTHFAVMTDAGEKDGQRIATQFERMHSVFNKFIPTIGDDSGPPIAVLAVKDRKAMQALEPEAYLGKGKVDLSGLFLYAPGKNYILVRLDADEEHAFSTVYHEYTHYLLRRAADWLPLWLNEGLAEFYENTEIGEKETRLGEQSVEDLNYLGQNPMIPLPTLFTVDAKSQLYHDEQKGSVFYAESWLLTHYLIVGDNALGTHRIHDYMELLAKGDDPVTTAQQAFGDLDELQLLLTRYALQHRFTYFILKEELPARDSSFQVRAVPAAEADAVRADVLICSERTKEAQALLESVLRDDPGEPLAHEAMGRLSLRAGDFAGAKKWYGEAAQLDPQSYLAHYYYAASAMRAGDRGDDDAIESNLRSAIQLNAEFAPPYDELAMFDLSRRRNLDEAHTLTARAIEIEPDNLGFRMDAADVMAQSRKFADAVEVLKLAERLARTPEEIEAVNSRIARYERYGAFDRTRDAQRTNDGSGK
jgi:tetratricopeptide (TPR) repeat protein